MLLGGFAWAGLPSGQTPKPEPQWILEWWEKDFPFDPTIGWSITAYAARATYRKTGEVRAKVWRYPTAYGHPHRWNQYQDAKAKMREWAKATLA